MKNDRTGSSLYLAGEWEPWTCLLIVLVASFLAWWLYRLETKKGTPAPLDKLLPFLRALAVALVVLTLAGPTLKNVSEKGERGRVLVFLDGSESMTIQDKHMSAGRKLLLAERHGWLPGDQQLLDPTLHEAADLLSVARMRLNDAMEDPTADLNQLAADFAGTAKRVAEMLKGKDYQVALPEERRGLLKHEVWKGIPGSELPALVSHTKFKEKKPDTTGYLKSAQSPTNVGEDFGRKISAILVPPSDGEYRFWIYADDQCILKLNDAGENADNAKEILRVPAYASADWQESLRSRPIRLRKDKRYYFEILHKEGGGDDFCAVGWTLPDGSLERPIPGKRFLVPNPDQTQTFADLLENMNQGVVQFAQSLRKGKGDAADSEMRKALSDLAYECLAHEDRFRETFDLYADRQALEKSSVIAQAMKDFDSSDRWKRATRLLTERQDSILRELKDTHIIEVRSLSGFEADHLWENGTDAEPPTNFGASPLTRMTDLASGILATVKADEDQEEGQQERKSRSAAVILSDGLHNKGSSPFETAKLMAGRDIPIHTVSFGSKKAPPDLAVLDVTTPPMILKTDRAHGSITLKDNLDVGTDFRIVVEDEQGNQVWDDNLSGINANRRRIDFDFSIEEMVEERILAMGLDNSVEVNSVAMRFKARVEPVKGESRTDNNLKSFSFDAITKKNSVLIIDGRPRWETRYLRNVFDRDERWTVTAVFAGAGAAQPDLLRGEDGESFPEDKKSLFAFDLVIFGELAAGLLKEEELTWINEFATNRGGGIILLDGPRQKFREYAKEENHPIAQLLPVKWLDETKVRLPAESFRLTERGRSETALFLAPSPERNAELWSYLPLPGWVAPTEALPGTEVFLEATTDKDKHSVESVPLLVSRTAGAGRILYAGFDGTWRWRFEVADKYHQRYWNQLASWIMEKPFAVRDEFVAIDPGASSYQPGESAALRIRVRDREGKPLSDPNLFVEGLIWKEGKIVATVPLETNAESGGLFRGNTPPLSSGQHEISVRVDGLYEENELRSRVGFLVRQPESPELSTLTCNEELLQEVAKLSGGTYLREEQIGRLNDLLKPISSGKLVTKEIALWQSYWWFIPIVLILGLELFLRKRAGML
jgi:hypothetical protein